MVDSLNLFYYRTTALSNYRTVEPMGITIVQKSDLAKNHGRDAKALILAGGAVTGGSFKAGGIKALNDYFANFRINDFDIFVGISSGSMIAAALMGGISPESILKSLDGTSGHFTPLTAWHYYRPNISELVSRPLDFLFKACGWAPARIVALAERYPEWSRGIIGAIWQFLVHPSPVTYDAMIDPIIAVTGAGDWPSLLALLPSGIFDNRAIESYFRHNIERNGLTNDFGEAKRLSRKSLYVTAMRLDGARRVIFGPDEDDSVTISQAIQASTAMPGFYKPARINGIDYVDGGVQETADIDIAIDKGARLIVCYNPFRPYRPKEFVNGFTKAAPKRLATDGVMAVLNQIFRSIFYERLHVALDKFRADPAFKGDIILIEPHADDRAFFALNPLSLSNRVEAAKLGFESVRNSIDKRYDEISAIMSAYGIAMNRERVEEKFRKISRSDASETELQSILEGRKNTAEIKKVRRRAKPKSDS